MTVEQLQEEPTQKRHPRSPRLVVEVPQEVIDKSIPKDSSGCIAAEAIKLQFPGYDHVAVDIQTIRLTDRERGLRYVYLTPRSVQEMIVDFDQGKLPEPGFSFRLQNGQVVKSGSRASDKVKRPRSPAQLAHMERMREARAAALQQTQLVQRMPGHVPEVIGGRVPPPVRGRFGKRRQFGIRGLER